MKKSGLALSNVTTFNRGSPSNSPTRSNSSSYVLSSITLIGGLSSDTLQCPGTVLSTESLFGLVMVTPAMGWGSDRELGSDVARGNAGTGVGRHVELKRCIHLRLA